MGALGLPPGCQRPPGLIAGAGRTQDTPSIPGDQAGRGAQPPDRQAEGWGGSERGLPVFPEPFFFFSPEMVISSGPTRRGAEPLRHPVTDGRWRLRRRSRARSASRSSLLSLWLMIYFGRHPPRLVTWLGREKKKIERERESKHKGSAASWGFPSLRPQPCGCEQRGCPRGFEEGWG